MVQRMVSMNLGKEATPKRRSSPVARVDLTLDDDEELILCMEKGGPKNYWCSRCDTADYCGHSINQCRYNISKRKERERRRHPCYKRLRSISPGETNIGGSPLLNHEPSPSYSMGTTNEYYPNIQSYFAEPKVVVIQGNIGFKQSYH